MAAAPWIIGGAVIGAGLFFATRKKKTKAKPTAPPTKSAPSCPSDSIVSWMASRSLTGTIVGSRAELEGQEPLDPSDRDLSVVLNECAVYVWNGSQWARDAGLTADMKATF